MNNNYLPINKFILINPEFGKMGPFKSIRDIGIKEFEDYCFVNADKNPHITFYGISRKMSGKEIVNVLGMGKDNLLYSYYDAETGSRYYFKAYSLLSYDNINPNKEYRIEINIDNDSFTIYKVDEE